MNKTIVIIISAVILLIIIILIFNNKKKQQTEKKKENNQLINQLDAKPGPENKNNIPQNNTAENKGINYADVVGTVLTGGLPQIIGAIRKK